MDQLIELLNSAGGKTVVVSALVAWLGKVAAGFLSKQKEQAVLKNVEDHKHLLKLVSTAKQESLHLSTVIDLDLRNHRLAKYQSLWEMTSILPKRPKADDVSYQDLEAFGMKLREWYFREGGMFLSHRTQKEGYVPLQDKIRDILDLGASGGISDEHYEQVRGKCSDLRSFLAEDIQSRREVEFRH